MQGHQETISSEMLPDIEVGRMTFSVTPRDVTRTRQFGESMNAWVTDTNAPGAEWSLDIQTVLEYQGFRVAINGVHSDRHMESDGIDNFPAVPPNSIDLRLTHRTNRAITADERHRIIGSLYETVLRLATDKLD